MIIPSIDLKNGHAVQLVGGREQRIDAGDPTPIARRFNLVGETAVIDLDAALGAGSNRETMESLLKIARCRVGGGIRDVDAAIRWLDLGASKVILGTAARPDVLRELPRERVMAALDALEGEVVVDGWRTKTGATVRERIAELRDCVGGFLVTFVEREGRMTGLPMAEIERLVEAAGDVPLTVAGGVKSAQDIAKADELGVDVQVGMALYAGVIDLAEAFCAPMRSDRPDGLWPTIVADERGAALGLVYSNLESVRASLDLCAGVYWSRSRKSLWRKGAVSGDVQELLGICVDCDRDALLFRVRQRGTGFCHRGACTCFGGDAGLGALARRIAGRRQAAPPGSYTKRLFDQPDLLAAKLREEVEELIEAETPRRIAGEAADVMYFTLCRMIDAGVSLEEVERELDRRASKVTRRD
ncbi:MAG: phosphoribosyl-ATP diphosphatase [Planctomycetota bacterium]|nr:MAG: phosphoribosyl-ATP diphosphatase [Planctomycetota bacterium]